MFKPDDFNRLAEDMLHLMADSTDLTRGQGEKINQIISASGKRRYQIVALLQPDADLFEVLNGPINLGILVSATLGTVTQEISDLILKKVAKVTNTTLE